MMIHFAGVDVHVNALLRQRCAWCGAVLVDYDLERIAVPVGQEGDPGTWPVGSLIAVDGGLSYEFDHVDGQPLPPESCALIDAAVTR